MGVYVFDGRSFYAGTDNADQFFMQEAMVGITVTGLDGADYVRGSRFGDYVVGGAGTDYLYGGAGEDTVLGGTGDDVLSGAIDNGDGTFSTDWSGARGSFGAAINPVVDRLYGEDGNDRILLTDLSGDIGYGGTGDDTFVVALPISYRFSSNGFTPGVVEAAGEGTDTVYVIGGGQTGSGPRSFPGRYDLPENVENLILLDGQYANTQEGYGNASANLLVGNSEANRLEGRGGDDLINGGANDDLLYGEDGADVLYGGVGQDLLEGGLGRDTLIGEAGSDTLRGGAGDDIYAVESAGDLVIELVGEGYDEIYASFDYALTENVETLFLTATATFGYGNGQNNSLIGNDVDNVLLAGDGTFEFLGGASGNDILIGGQGHDQLMGGGGADYFRLQNATTDVFNGSSNDGDFIYDFNTGQGDKIQLNAAAFGFGFGVIAQTNFVAGTGPAPTQASPTLLYSTVSGGLFYDADGTGDGGIVLLATVGGAPNLSASDFALY